MKHLYILTTIICFGCLTSNGQRVLFTDNFGTYSNGEDLSTNSSGWIHTGVGGFTNKINATYGAPKDEKSNCFGQLTGNGMASAHRDIVLTSGETYRFSAYLKSTLTTTDYSTISIIVGGISVATSNTLAEKNVWEKMTVEYTATSDETATFSIEKSEGQTLNIDKIRISCTSCADKKFVYNFRDSKESWVVKAGCTLGLNKESMIIKATSTTPITMSGDITQDLALNTEDYNRAKITFKTPYAMAGAGYGKFFLYSVAGGNSEFATYDFVRDASNTTTFQTAEIDLTDPLLGTYSGQIARIGIRAPWGIPNGGQAFIQRIELYKETTVKLDEIKNSSYNVKLYPNPALNSITLNLEGITKADIEFLDIQGKLIFSKNQVFNQEQIDISRISKGTYFLRIISDKGNQQIKLRVK